MNDGGEVLGFYPKIFHHVKVGPAVRAQDLVTDLYLPSARDPDRPT